MTEVFNLQKSPVTFSDSAVAEIKKLKVKEEGSKHLRIGAKNGGCSGLTYLLEFDSKKENDKEFSFQDISFIIDPSHMIYLKGMLVEFNSGLNARGFAFKNPNATNTCGCGTSFAV